MPNACEHAPEDFANHLPSGRRFLFFGFLIAALGFLLFDAAGAPDGSVTHKIQVPAESPRASALAQGGKLLADYGNYQLYEVSDLPAESLLTQENIEVRDEYNLVRLNARTLDTTKSEIKAMRQAPGNFSGKRMHLVQFAGPVNSAWLEELQQLGAQVICYLPENAYLLRGDEACLERIHGFAASAPHIQWDAAYTGDLKIHPAAQTVDAAGNPVTPATDSFSVQLVADEETNPETLALIDQLKLEPVKKQARFQQYLNVIVRLAPTGIASLAARPDVVSIHLYLERQKFCERQDQIIAGNLSGNLPSGPGYLLWLASKGFTQAQFTNSGFCADVSDSGLDNGTQSPNHAGLRTLGLPAGASRVQYNRLEGRPNNPGSSLKGCDGHGTLNSHVIGGYDDAASGFPHTDAAGFHYGLGVCPFVRLGSSVIFDPDSFTFPNFATLQSTAYHDGARVSNNSWGANTSGDYDIECQEYDALVRDAQPSASPFPVAGNQEMTICFAAGNAGSSASTVGSPGAAKNVITVGAAENVQAFGGSDGCGVSDNQANSANDIINFSSRGPCADGRRKPDIVAPGTHVSGGVAQANNPALTGTADSCFTALGVCGLANGNFFPVGQELFTVSSGTSHSTPALVGGCALVRQYFINNFGAPASPAMTKAFLMNSARYLTGVGANDSLWSNSQGLGEMNLGFAFDGIQRVLRDETTADLFTASGQKRTFTGTISDSTKPFRVTVAWTDAPGGTSGNAYNNNLDLVVTIGTNTYKGNVFSGSNSVTGGVADAKNNVENVFLPVGLTGAFTVVITAANINSDGVPNNGIALDQDFALVIYNAALISAPVISRIQPTNQIALMNQPVTFTATVSGSTPISYQWQHQGTNVPGATTNVLFLAAAQPPDSGNYQLLATNVYGAATSGVVTLTVLPTVPLPFALDNNSLGWTTGANSPWYGQTNISHDGIASAQTFILGDNQTASLNTTVTGPGTLSFFWKVSSQTNADHLNFAVNGTNLASLSGEVDWQQKSFFLPAGGLALQWSYSKDASGSGGQDTAWVDQASYVSGGTVPFLTQQPVNKSSVGGAPVTFTAAADGTPTLSYQWQFNGTDIPGATTSSYTLPSPTSADSGAYVLRVTNAYGLVFSQPAVLGVVPLLALGDNSLGQLNVAFNATNAMAISAGAWHNLALTDAKTVVAWGNNGNGQCDVPTNLQQVASIAAGGYHSLALRLNGTVAAWGANFDGEAAPPADLQAVTAVAAGSWHSLALLRDGTVRAWGDNTWGQLSVPDLGEAVAIAAGGNHNLALLKDGTVATWGENTDSQGIYAGQSTVPAGLGDVIAIAAGDYHSLAVRSNGTVVAWGDNSSGQCDVPSDLAGVIAVAGGGSHSVALKANGTVAAWGNDLNGQCDLASGQTNIVAVSAGSSHSLLLIGNLSQAPQLLAPAHPGSQFSVVVRTFAGRNYSLEYRTSVSSGTWLPVTTVPGIGGFQVLADPSATGPARFYRVRSW